MAVLQNPQVLMLLLSGVAGLVMVVLLATGQKGGAARRLKRLAEGSGDAQSASGGGTETAEVTRERQRKKAVDKELKKQKERLKLIQAGLYSRGAAAVFASVRIVFFCVFVGAAALCGVLGLLPLNVALILSAVSAIFATLAPSFWLDQAKSRRQTVIRRALPDALDILGVCMAGGLSLEASIGRVSRELATAHPALALELAIVDRETQLGRSVGQALREFAYRFDMEELRNLSTVIIQAQKFGSSLTKTLDIYAETLRTKRQQRAEELAQKAAIKILFPTLFCIFPAMFVVILGPAAIQIYEFMTQNGAIKGAGGMF